MKLTSPPQDIDHELDMFAGEATALQYDCCYLKIVPPPAPLEAETPVSMDSTLETLPARSSGFFVKCYMN